MQAYKAEATVDPRGGVRVRHVPFQPGAVVEVIVLEPEQARSPKEIMLDPQRQAALDRSLNRSYSLGGQFPVRDDLHER